MRFELYKFIYFNILLILLFLLNNLFLFMLILFYKLPYIINVESDLEYEFEFFSSSFETVDAQYLDLDIDDEFFYTILNQEFYLSFNCRFFFDLYGGNQVLDFIDFIDFTIYNINDSKNLKNLYITNNYFYKYDLNNSYLSYNFKEDYLDDLNIEYYIKKINDDKINNDNIYNIACNIEVKNKVKLKQRLNFLKYKY